jgi:GT2 family glycosyltransferase
MEKDMTNPALVLTHNGLDLTKRCVESLRKQDIDTSIFVVDNGSSDETVNYTQLEQIPCLTLLTNTGFSYGINIGLKWVLELTGADYCLVPNNDTQLAPYGFRELLAYNIPFVSGRETTTLSDLDLPFEQGPLGGGPQFSAFLIRKSAWNTIGEFDTAMVSWASDIDYHLRAHRLGIELHSAPVIYYHERSSTINKANPREKRALEMQADGDRLAFAEKWGFAVGSPEHHAAFSPEFFGIDVKK